MSLPGFAYQRPRQNVCVTLQPWLTIIFVAKMLSCVQYGAISTTAKLRRGGSHNRGSATVISRGAVAPIQRTQKGARSFSLQQFKASSSIESVVKHLSSFSVQDQRRRLCKHDLSRTHRRCICGCPCNRGCKYVVYALKYHCMWFYCGCINPKLAGSKR